MFINANELDNVEGIGKKNKEKIITHFENKHRGGLPTYLNQRQKDEIMMIGAVLSGAHAYKERYIEHGNNEYLRECLEMIEYGADKFINTMTTHLDTKQRRGVLTHAKSFEIDFKPKKQYVKMYEAEEEKENVIILSEEQGDILFELTQASCSVCQTPGEGCKFKDLLIDMGVEVLNQNPKKNECAFRYPKKNGGKK